MRAGQNRQSEMAKTYVACVHQEAPRSFRGFFNEHTLLIPIPNVPLQHGPAAGLHAGSP